MRSLLVACLLSLLSFDALSQRLEYYKPVTVQVSPTIIDYDGLKYGVALGANIEEIVSIGYFHLRDYEYGDNYFDNRYAGLYFNLAIPVSKNLEIGPTTRFATINAEWQNLAFAGELKYKFSRSVRMSIEKSIQSDQDFWSAKLIFNLY